ncbi:hypothetical protein Verru16b_01025 [Lacunisphaera limnophila]|uniref:Glycosyltransferase RgtA/B/C/D-like domain-containing protein n=1 Tax=Lacunisphaera limnophila TaxID=1838286 RepID=A0A1D8ASU4_9BACT|nr:hypothetical protein [Lacunisphaera limnophila]AOS43965.1 hypothetical protein Verru16b_01025 [Lacunisphaera limnophila]
MFDRLRAHLPSAATGNRVARGALLVAFALLIARFWSPYYGFTSLLQADPVTEALLPASLRDAPVFIHREAGRYDGAYYAQIATSPALRDPELATAVDDLGYRARRILLSAVAWVAGGGAPVAAVHAYAWLNVIVWFGLAGILWRVLPAAGGWRNTAAWAAVLLASGTLASVRLALTDLAATTLLAGGLLLIERGREKTAALCLGLAGLARETALLGAGAWWPEGKTPRGLWVRRGLLALLAGLPLVVWWSYVQRSVGPSSAGSENVTLPLVGWLGEWRELWRSTGVEANRGLLLCGWLDLVALTGQAAYLLCFRETRSPWWRVGLLFVLLGAVLGPAVWEGLPGAYSRVLLPVALVFNVLAARRRAALGWLLLGNLSVVSGLWSFHAAPGAPHLLTSAAAGRTSYVLETDARWSVAEWNNRWRWSWCEGEGGLSFRVWPHQSHVQVELQVRGVTPRALEVWHAGVRVWQGRIGDRPEWITLPSLPAARGGLALELRSPAPPAQEGAANTARGISFACFGARLVPGRATSP